jgi:hypothetical protein
VRTGTSYKNELIYYKSIKINSMKTALFVGWLALCFSAGAQNEALLPDQNPNYMNSQKKYMDKREEASSSQGQTVQNTYQAIDEFQRNKKQRIERRMQRRQWRHQEQMAYYNNAYPNSYYYNPYNHSNYYSPYYSPYGYGCRYNSRFDYGNNGVFFDVANTALSAFYLYSLFR